ncbi:hypothetical protein PS6_007147 [Mucor atramentarius]
MEEESNLSVRDAVRRLERSLSAEQSTRSQSSISDFSIPGYLRTTASASSKTSTKRKDEENNDQQHYQKRRQFPSANSVMPTKTYGGQPFSRQDSRESSVFSIASTVREDAGDNEDTDEEGFQRVILYAKYLQWVVLTEKAKIAFEHKKQAIERELAIAREALKEKRRREAALLKEKNGMLDDRDVGKYVEQAQQVAKRMIAKKAVKNYDWAEEKKELAVILGQMNDLKASIDVYVYMAQFNTDTFFDQIPMESVHKSIKELIRARELMQTILDMPEPSLK